MMAAMVIMMMVATGQTAAKLQNIQIICSSQVFHIEMTDAHIAVTHLICASYSDSEARDSADGVAMG